MSAQTPYTFERLDADKAVLLVVDHQLGLLQLVRDYTTAEFRNNILAHAELGKLFDLPVIMTTSAETGPNGPLPKEIIDMYPNAPFIKRNGEVNAWDNPDFKKAVEATGRKQVILGGIVTEVCTMFLALSLREAGYSVWANTEASGTASPKLAEDANRRMERAGVHLVSYLCLCTDWRLILV
jgi:nicotinamidase-related amidase